MTDALAEKKECLEEDIRVLVEMTQSIVKENAHIILNQDEYQKHYDRLVQRYDKVVADISAKEAHGERLANFIRTLKEQDKIIQEFNSNLLGYMVEFITVSRNKEIMVIFWDDTEI